MPMIRLLFVILAQLFNVRAHAGIDIHILCFDVHLPIASPQLPAEVQCQNERRSKVLLEEVGCVRRSTEREERGVELRNHAQNVERESNIAADDAEKGLVGYLVEGVALRFPSGAEADV